MPSTPLRPLQSAAPPAAPPGRLRGALSVALATLGVTVQGSRGRRAAARALRRRLHISGPLNLTLNTLLAGDPEGVRLILVHGTPGCAEGWADYLLDPPAGCEVIALDRPGFGASSPSEALPSLAAQAAAVAALLPSAPRAGPARPAPRGDPSSPAKPDLLRRDGRKALLLGHSLGGAVAARVAADHPQRIGALVLLAASLDPALETIHALQRIGAWAPVRRLLPRALRNSNDELIGLRAQLEQLAALLPRITAPVLIVHGTDDPLVPVANVRYMQTQLIRSSCVRVMLLEGRNHFLPWNSAAQVREAIRVAREMAC